MLSPDDIADALVWSVTRPLHVEVDELRLRYS
jgi:NADP-dependent 3-hydroxy acid dehydrogenase YdfG